MYLQEVFNAIFKNHLYEYFVIDRHFKIIEYSDEVSKYCEEGGNSSDETDIFMLLPELFGIERELQEVFDGLKDSFVIPYILKDPNYVNMRIHPGRQERSFSRDEKQFETLIILFENVTETATVQQSLIQERNERTLLLEELADKNRQLKRFNEQMQEVVDEQIKLNLEKQKTVELQSRHAQIGEMIGMISHQWKQPLNAINAISTLLKLKHQTGKLDAELFNINIENIFTQTEHMNQTVNDFQRFFNPRKEKVSFNLLENISTILTLVEIDYKLNDITLELDGDESIVVYGYPNEYNQVILSILKNAKDAFLAAPHDYMQITISLRRHNDRSVVTIKDNAGGIPDHIIDTIFDLYMTTKDEGSGLGLNIAKSVIESNMDGRLDVRNIQNGAEFSIYL